MRILHLTDFHYDQDSKSNHDHIKFVETFTKDIESQKFDLVLFTGDLVFSGDKKENFEGAKKNLFEKIIESFLNQKNNLIFCCGNHDVQRNQELIDTAETISEISDNSKLEAFLSRQKGKSFKESLKNLSNYNDFQKQYFSEYSISDADISTDLYSIHFRIIDSVKIGILTINSAWRAIDSIKDRGSLIFPISLLKKAIGEIKSKSDFRIIIMHHPISDFKDWNAPDIEDLVFSEFDMMFSGHLHKKKQSIQISTEKGLFCCVASGTLTPDKKENGYSIIDIDLSSYDIEISNHYFNNDEGVFLSPSKTTKISLPVGEGKRESNDFRKLFRKRFLEEKEKANELFISYDEREVGKGFLDLFTDPILKSKTQAQIAKNQSDTKNILLVDLLSSKENYLIFGKDKSGKTSILFKCMLDLFQDFTVFKTFPLYFDYKELIKSEKALDIYKVISNYYEMNSASAKSLPNRYPIVLLIDNYDPGQEKYNQIVNSFLECHPLVSFISTTEEKLATSYAPLTFNNAKYSNLYVHEISRPEVRMLASKWPNLTTEKREIILNKLTEIFVQLNIPMNYWTVSLFIWIFEKNNDANFHSSFELIQLYIENLLDRKRIALDKNFKLKFDDLKIYLAYLAYFLLKDRAKVGYTASYSDIVTFTSSYREKNKRFVIEVQDIIDLILHKNILKKVSVDRFTFRLNGVFEYFLALYMSVDKSFRNSIISDDHFFLSFKNEFELLAGFEKNNDEYVGLIFEKTKVIYANTFAHYSQKPIDIQLLNKVSEVFDITLPLQQLEEKNKNPLSIEKQDEILSEIKPLDINNTEVTVKKYHEEISDNSDNLEDALHILARVLRNSNVQNQKEIDDLLDYILNASCYLGFKLIDEFQADEFKDISEPEDENIIVQLITNFMPLIVQTLFFDSLAQNDLERIFHEKIDELKKDSKSNQFKLLLLYLTLIDLDLNTHKVLIDELIELIDLDILKQTIVLKLYILLMFKCEGKPHLEDYIKSKIKIQTTKIDPKFDKTGLQKGLIKTTRIVHLKDNRKKNKK